MRLTGRVLTAATLVATVAGCAPPERSATPGGVATLAPTTEVATPLTVDQLRNATYALPDGRTVVLAEGLFQEKPDPSAATWVANFALAEDLIAFGDLDADGAEDAVVILFDSPGGSGVFGYVAAVRSVDGEPVNVASAELGDRVQVRSNSVGSGVIVLEVLAHAFEDQLCCPTAELVWRYGLDGNKLRRSGKSTTDG